MAENIFELTSKNFDGKISKGIWIVDFWAEWCGPCKIMEPHFAAAAKELKGKVSFGKVDVESEQELAERFQVVSIPTLVVFKKGEPVNRAAGARREEDIIEFINES